MTRGLDEVRESYKRKPQNTHCYAKLRTFHWAQRLACSLIHLSLRLCNVAVSNAQTYTAQRWRPPLWHWPIRRRLLANQKFNTTLSFEQRTCRTWSKIANRYIWNSFYEAMQPLFTSVKKRWKYAKWTDTWITFVRPRHQRKMWQYATPPRNFRNTTVRSEISRLATHWLTAVLLHCFIIRQSVRSPRLPCNSTRQPSHITKCAMLIVDFLFNVNHKKCFMQSKLYG